MGSAHLENVRGLREIELPDSVEIIGDHAFGLCYSLKTIELPDSVKYLGEFAFAGCHSLKKAIIGKDLKVDKRAFYPNYWKISIIRRRREKENQLITSADIAEAGIARKISQSKIEQIKGFIKGLIDKIKNISKGKDGNDRV